MNCLNFVQYGSFPVAIAQFLFRLIAKGCWTMRDSVRLTFGILSYLLPFVLVIGIAEAAEKSLPEPEGEILLEVTGAVTRSNCNGRACFDRSMLEAFPETVIETTTPWTDGVQEFRGVVASDLLDYVGIEGDELYSIALNGYRVRIPLSDLEQYPVLLAMKRNGQRMTVRDYGPIWLVYPRDDFPEIAAEVHNPKWIWQLKELNVR